MRAVRRSRAFRSNRFRSPQAEAHTSSREKLEASSCRPPELCPRHETYIARLPAAILPVRAQKSGVRLDPASNIVDVADLAVPVHLVVGQLFRVLEDEVAPWLDLHAHQNVEHLLRRKGLLDHHLCE